MKYKFGTFVREYKIYGTNTVFFVRGLTVSEYLDILSLTTNSKSKLVDMLFYRIAYTGIVGWKDFVVFDEDEGVQYDVPFSEEGLDYIPEEWLNLIGEYIYYSLTLPSEIEIAKYRGHIRFKYFVSDDDNKSASKYFNCKDCIQHNLWIGRKCGLQQHERDVIFKKTELPEEIIEKKKETKSRYGSKNKRAKEVDESRPKVTLLIQGYEFPECPISWVDRDIQEWADRLYYSAKANGLFFSGGQADQQNKIFELQRIVSSEANLIEYENMKKQHESAKKK